jgi:phosphatidate cytidylyltransferase
VTHLAQRVAVGAVAIPLIVLLCMVGGIYFFLFIAVASAVALREFYVLAHAKGAKPLIFLGITGGFFINLSFFLYPTTQPPVLVPVLLIIIIIVSLTELYHNNGSAVLNLATTLLGVLYISLFFGTLIGIREMFALSSFPIARFLPGESASQAATQIHAWGGYMTISVFVVIWICDSAGMHLGSAFGKHKLFPRVSPKKTWEGAIAGLICAVVAALAAKQLLLSFLPLSGAFIIGGIVGTIGQLGDLIESLMKRDAGVKDSSGLIPGHGGAFDRFDSVLLVSPCVYMYLAYVLKG